MKLLVRCMHTLDPLLIEFDSDGLKVSCVNNGMYLNQSVLSSESVCYTNTTDLLLWTKHKAILLPSVENAAAQRFEPKALSTPEFLMNIDDVVGDMHLGDMDLDEMYADACAIADGTGATGNAVPISGNANDLPVDTATAPTSENVTIENTTAVGPNKPGAGSGSGSAAATPGKNVPAIDVPVAENVALDAGNATEDFEEESVAPTTPTKRLSVEDVPSGMSGFQLYCRWYQRAVKKEIATPREDGCVTKELYRRWRTLSEEEQTRWKSLVN